MRSSDVLAILISDVHWSHTPPLARVVEPSWYETQAGYCKQLKNLSEEFNAPIIAAGDILHKWNCPIELVNFLLDHMPTMYAVPGQHDLPYHQYSEMHKSAYWTLARAGKIKHLNPYMPTLTPRKDLVMVGYPWEHKPKPISRGLHKNLPHLAVIHSYCWIKGHEYMGAPNISRAKQYLIKLKGFDVAMFGDNHSGFLLSKTKPIILNCGTFMRRRADERDYQPKVGLLRSDRTVERLSLDCSGDRFTEEQQMVEMVEKAFDLGDLVEELNDLSEVAIDFAEAMNVFFKSNKVSKGIRRLIMKSMENKHAGSDS